MEMGRTVVLLNMESLYESLYDALNQVRFSHLFHVSFFSDFFLQGVPFSVRIFLICFFCEMFEFESLY